VRNNKYIMKVNNLLIHDSHYFVSTLTLATNLNQILCYLYHNSLIALGTQG
jgi:hypothetical protein